MPPRPLTPWGDTPLSSRLVWLRRFRRRVADERASLCDLIHQDMGKPPTDALVQDILPLLSACRWLERRAPAILTTRRAGWGGLLTLGQSHRIARLPLGEVAIIATWNYPVQLLGIQLAHALVAGNSVTVKPSECAPGSQPRLLELARDAGLTDDALRWTPATRDAGPAMLREHRFDHLVFTGSTAVGREIALWAAQTLTPTTLELSGRDSAFVLADADPALAARSIWFAVIMNAGQTCTAPRRALVLRRVYPAFLRALAPLAASVRPLPLVSESAAAHAWAQVADTLAQPAATTQTPAPRSLSAVAEPPRGRDFTPIALVDCTRCSPLVRGDHFAPALAVVPVDSLEEALDIHHDCDQHLAAGVYTRSRDAACHLAPRLGAAVVTVNDSVVPTGHPAVGLAGKNESGWGISRGPSGLLAMTRPVHVTTTSPWLRPPVDPMTAGTTRALSRLAGWMYGSGPVHAPRDSVPAPRSTRQGN